ncbi:MAG: imidazole glycerol phosphate synthase subunit HisH [Candidatus Anoxymicrobium japonicum]|uniref:Imidazole glycerol phosphate synthase subunit HisH n=1 Tax=Candidatus Anoxymicrobium japonicum TaxID=2013648 RepID=A0A2N3G6A8_9ACTN|nr:MAG: imidazole glycerol phosphate synthase subunit HisH [Candidatus Anoxymicrobium japonicum]
MALIGVIDYGVGNLHSVQKGLEKVGVDAVICSHARELDGFDGLVLPGVGAFGDAMKSLMRLNMDTAILNYIETGRHVLGICLGMQLLFEYSEEHGRNEGLGVVPGGVVRLPDSVKVPHMGWNVLGVKRPNPLFEGIGKDARFYFVHSFYCAPADDSWTIGTTEYGLEFACAMGKDNVWGAQFHPEKSSLLGLEMLKNFGRLAGACA